MAHNLHVPNKAGKENCMNNTTHIANSRTESVRAAHIERIESAANDFRTAGAQISAALEIARHNSHPDQHTITVLTADLHDAQRLARRLDTITEFADSTEQIIEALVCMVRTANFGIDCWNVMHGADDAAMLLDALDISRVVANADGVEATIYDAKAYEQRTMFAHVIALRYYMAHQLGAVDPAGPQSADLKRFRTERTAMLSTYNALLEYAPNDLRISGSAYDCALTALNMATSALGILIAQGETLVHEDSADETWRAYCNGDEAVAAKTAIMSAYMFSVIDIF